MLLFLHLVRCKMGGLNYNMIKHTVGAACIALVHAVALHALRQVCYKHRSCTQLEMTCLCTAGPSTTGPLPPPLGPPPGFAPGHLPPPHGLAPGMIMGRLPPPMMPPPGYAVLMPPPPGQSMSHICLSPRSVASESLCVCGSKP